MRLYLWSQRVWMSDFLLVFTCIKQLKLTTQALIVYRSVMVWSNAWLVYQPRLLLYRSSYSRGSIYNVVEKIRCMDVDYIVQEGGEKCPRLGLALKISYRLNDNFHTKKELSLASELVIFRPRKAIALQVSW